MQRIIIGGVGGQGVLFISRVLSEAAVAAGLRVRMSETIGMAQRGGNVVTHVKVATPEEAKTFAFASPLVMPGEADLFIALHPDAVAAHSYFLKPGGVSLVNGGGGLDAFGIARELGIRGGETLVMLGVAAASGALFCDAKALEEALVRLSGARREANMAAFRAGLSAFGKAA